MIDSRMVKFLSAIGVTIVCGVTFAGDVETPEQVNQFIGEADERVGAAGQLQTRANWIFTNFITHDTQQMLITAKTNYSTLAGQVSREAFDAMSVPGLSLETRRNLELIRHNLVLPPPTSAAQTGELVALAVELRNIYSTGKYCEEPGQCSVLRDMSLRMTTSRDPEELLALWQGWRAISPPMRPLYTRQVALANSGARELGYADLGDYWRSRFDMSSAEFAADTERYWQQAKPLYDALQCHVAGQLEDFYGEEHMPDDGTIPAHLLGNMWAQGWSNIEDVVMGEKYQPPYDLTAILAQRDMDEVDMVKLAEGFFISLGMEPLPETFWERSLFTRPKDREVVCHASAWSVDGADDLRIKMCMQRTGEDLGVVHHELGHNYYQRAYKNQPYYHRGSANPGFHEAVGDTMSLSVTPDYLVKIGLVDNLPATTEELEIAYLMKVALDKVAFLPFALVMDRWRWQVFSGEVTPDNYNAAWWQLRKQYQGVSSPVPRTEEDFDPGAKYHIAANVSYTRYFLAHLLQFQFHQKMCELAEYDGPLHRCSAYGSKAAGSALGTLLSAGRSAPWQDTLEAFTGSRDIDAAAMLDYFAPLHRWLDKQNEGRQCGWRSL